MSKAYVLRDEGLWFMVKAQGSRVKDLEYKV
jgi:hypothetical protein